MIDEGSTNRSSHLEEKIKQEQAQREQRTKDMFDKCRAEGDAVLQEQKKMTARF